MQRPEKQLQLIRRVLQISLLSQICGQTEALPKLYFRFCRRQLETPYLKLTKFPENHTGDNVAEAKETIQSWELDPTKQV